MNSRAVVKNIIVNKESINTIIIEYPIRDSFYHFLISGHFSTSMKCMFYCIIAVIDVIPTRNIIAGIIIIKEIIAAIESALNRLGTASIRYFVSIIPVLDTRNYSEEHAVQTSSGDDLVHSPEALGECNVL